MAKGIKSGVVPRSRRNIPDAPRIGADDLLRFSFKLLDLTGDKFCVDRCKGGYLDRFLTRLRDLSSLKVGEFRTNRSSALRSHPIDFSTTSEPKGFSSLNDQLRAEQPWQFEITSNEHGRVHGLLIDDTFYVVWIDADHLLYGP
jgi:hypothetical protein